MTAITLLTKIYNSHQLREIDQILADMIGDLSVDVKVTGTANGRWVQLEVSGEDEGIATKLLQREIGFCPVSLENVKKFSALKGYVVNFAKSVDGLFIDAGIFQPTPIHPAVPLSYVQTHFAAGKGTSLKSIGALWGFCENLPVEIKVLDIYPEEKRITAEFQPTYVRKMQTWKESLLDRLLIIGASINEVNTAIEEAGLQRDIIEVEGLGLFEHAIVCKLGTDAAGLIGRIGYKLRKAKFTVFNPKKLQ